MEWGGIDRDEWEALSAAAPLQQTWLWGDVLAAIGALVERRAARGRASRALAQVTTRRLGPLSLSLLSRGPVWIGTAPERPALGGLSRALPGGPRVLLVTPDTGAPARALPLVTPAWHAALEITPPQDALRAGLDPKLRNKVSRAERAGLDIRREDAAPPWLLEAETAQQSQRRYRNWPPMLVTAWATLGGSVCTYVARDGGSATAAMLFLLHGHVATYHIGWSGAEGRQAAAHPLCLWHAICDLREAGVRRIDLGTVNTQDAPGLARFKIATGATVRPLGATSLVLPGD